MTFDGNRGGQCFGIFMLQIFSQKNGRGDLSGAGILLELYGSANTQPAPKQTKNTHYDVISMLY